MIKITFRKHLSLLEGWSNPPLCLKTTDIIIGVPFHTYSFFCVINFIFRVCNSFFFKHFFSKKLKIQISQPLVTPRGCKPHKMKVYISLNFQCFRKFFFLFFSLFSFFSPLLFSSFFSQILFLINSVNNTPLIRTTQKKKVY